MMKNGNRQNDEIMELLWQNGQVVLQSQNQRQQLRKPPSPAPARNTGAIPAEPSSAREVRVRPSEEEENYHNQHLFMQDDEMASWLHYSIDEDPPPLDHHDFCSNMLYEPQPAAASRPPILPARRIQNFAHFSKHGSNARAEMAPPARLKAARELTVVDSCKTPAATATATAVAAASRTSVEHGDTGRRSVSATGKPGSSAGRETATYEMTVTSSPGVSSGSAEPVQREPVVDRKRKGREPEESEFQSEDVDIESPEAKKQVRGSTSSKRTRAAEVHNLSERRRRDRINEKMRALQELIPRCNKSDKASMLDEAIEYLKSLQLQVQMMSMGCGMLPMMFPGIQQYMPPMGMGIGMGMGIEMGMNRPAMPFPNILGSSALPAATAATHFGPRFPMPPFHMPHVPALDSSRMQAPNQSDNHNMSLTSLGTPDPDQSRMPNFTDSYQQYLGPHQMHFHLMQATNQPNVTKPSTSRVQDNPEKHQPEQT